VSAAGEKVRHRTAQILWNKAAAAEFHAGLIDGPDYEFSVTIKLSG
jgi:hypothetical protein